MADSGSAPASRPTPTLATNQAKRPKLRAAQVWAAWGVVLLLAQAHTWNGFFAHGPHQVWPEGPTDPLAMWGARYFQVQNWIVFCIVATYVIRQCRREGRLTFDAQFCIAGLLTYWCDPLVEFFAPIFFNSSYYVNVADWTGFVPFIVNPDAGRILEPWVMLLPLYATGFLTYAIFLNMLMDKARVRYPNCSGISLYALAFVTGAAVEIAVEMVWLKLRLVSYPGAPDFLAIYVGGLKMPWIEYFTGGMVFASFSCVRYFTDREERRLPERGWERLPARLRPLASTLAMMAILNTLMISASLMDAFVGLYSAPYRAQPAHLLNGACDAPGFTGTRYGACPGSPGFRLPLAGSLPGRNPNGRN